MTATGSHGNFDSLPSSLYTREPGCFRTSESVGVDALIDPSYLLLDFSLGPMKGIGPYKNSPGCPKTILSRTANIDKPRQIVYIVGSERIQTH